MKCRNCSKEIKKVKCHFFGVAANPETLGAVETEEYYEAEIQGGGESAYWINVPTNITALEFTDSIPDLVDSISCPECDEFPFKNNAVELYNETVDMVFMGEEQLDEV
ncbi:hypothetical protein [Lactococcus garvieae]|uniref:hypothetical protein n=1 Tax=Lactococcus garvieae TaxID=1363 RepID=UPI0022E475E6|nr:hypothetical protein [Lactococcus garvieae]